MKNGNSKRRNNEKNLSKKNLKENFLKMIKLSNKRQINRLLKDSINSQDFQEKIMKILKNDCIQNKTDTKETEQYIKDCEKLYSLNKMEEKILEKLNTLNKMEKEIKSMDNLCICKEIIDIITDRFEKDSLTNNEINKVLNIYNDMINDINHFDNL